MFGSRKLAAALAVGALAAALAGCEEDLKGGAACPSLCPEQKLEVVDTVLSPVSLDTTVSGYPTLGSESGILLTMRGDTLQTAAVARFDTLLDRVTRITDTAQQHLVSIDTANVVINVSDTLTRPRPVTFDVYNVDTDAADIDTAAVRALFTGDRLLASRTVPRDSVRGAVLVPLPTSFLTARVKGAGRVRLGVAIRSDTVVQFVVGSNETGNPIQLRYLARAATDTQTITVAPYSKSTPQPNPAFADISDYQLVIRGAPPLRDPSVLAVGGMPGSRAYLRFDLPAGIVESTTVVRATLTLTQRPNRAVAAADSVTLLPRLVRATNVLNAEPGKAALVLGRPDLFATLRVTPGDSGQRQIQIPTALQAWRAEDKTKVPRAIVLQVTTEGSAPQLLYFFSTDAPGGLRPTLTLSYIPRAGFGLP